MKLYSGAEYKNPLTTIKFYYASRCYSLDCDALDNKAASAKWENLPNSSTDTLIFYSQADCTGYRGIARLSIAAGVRNFDQLKGTISSFMVKTKTTTSDTISNFHPFHTRTSLGAKQFVLGYQRQASVSLT
ncbi:hypothetical protein PF005_g20018 [Phytophthora fragariae]|nr:hypothetical protein PF003_g17031 [Phytophthora fragariae]KAE8927433.1 hypothetical protein PF009_g22397 [Phytophthora fragariae]KAE8989084.1 hypothetical protein PF011_g18919 [Phytophthora fragariae]KAE9086161.1 hypothetical protein PF010_g20185 [Phytophthora fragariae]KAE9117004.1 hypothetical protein PF006_g18915 [Phytophthora fragariae]